VLRRSAEGFEDEGEHGFWNGLPLVGDLDDDLRALGARLDDHGRPRHGVLDRVPGDVGERLCQPVRIPGACQVPFQLQLYRGPELLDDVSADLAQIGRLRFNREAAPESRPREIEQLRDHSLHALTAAEDDRGVRRVLPVQVVAQKQPAGGHDDRRERVTEVVAQNTDEHLAKLRQLAFLIQ
jgi:hypothetical protein